MDKLNMLSQLEKMMLTERETIVTYMDIDNLWYKTQGKFIADSETAYHVIGKRWAAEITGWMTAPKYESDTFVVEFDKSQIQTINMKCLDGIIIVLNDFPVAFPLIEG